MKEMTGVGPGEMRGCTERRRDIEKELSSTALVASRRNDSDLIPSNVHDGIGSRLRNAFDILRERNNCYLFIHKKKVAILKSQIS